MITLNQSMIKELSLAIVFGLLIGLGLTGTFFYLRQGHSSTVNSQKITAPSPIPTNLTPTSTSSNSSTNTLSVSSLQNNDIVATSKITLTGLFTPNGLLFVTTPQKNYHTTVDAQGQFSLSIDLEPGLNDINLLATDSQDRESRLELFITYSTAKIE